MGRGQPTWLGGTGQDKGVPHTPKGPQLGKRGAGTAQALLLHTCPAERPLRSGPGDRLTLCPGMATSLGGRR